MRYLASILIAPMLCGCAAICPVESLDSAQIAAQTEVAHDETKNTMQVEGPKLVFGEFQENYYQLNATRPEGEPAVRYSLAMRTLRKRSLGGIGWKAAADEHGKAFTLVKEAKQTNEDLLYETVAFEVTREWLDHAVTKEAKVQVAGATNNLLLILPTNYVSGFVGRVDQEFLLRN